MLMIGGFIMKIKSLELLENKKIKNIKLDFTINDIIQDTIIFAGNNGCGKTTILEQIYVLTNYIIAINLDRNKGKITAILWLEDSEKNM